MDGSRFDALTRMAASAPSRRRFLAAAIGGLAATVLGDRAEAAVKRGPGVICRKNGDCASGLCNAADRTGRQYCGCTDPSQCPQPTTACSIATCNGGSCGITVNVGAPCDDQNACTSGDTCQADGNCGGGTATVCTALDQCHTAGTCDPATGICLNPDAADGTACTATGSAAGTCQSGACVATSTCLPAGSPCECANPDACCSGTCNCSEAGVPVLKCL